MTVRVVVTPQIGRFFDCPPADVEGQTLGEALEGLFARTPRLRGYVLDDRGQVRRHVRIFVDGHTAVDLAWALEPGSEIYMM